METSFKTIGSSRRGLNMQVAGLVAGKILSGELPENSIIPSEQELCEQIGISRTTIREAIKSLASKRLLESRPKIGTRVLPKTEWNILDPQLLEWMTASSDPVTLLSQFLGLRRSIEPEACALAAVNASAQQRIDISNAFQAMIDVSKDFDRELWKEVDLAFHCLIFHSTGNFFFVPFGNILKSVYTNFFHYSSEDGGMCFEEHREIYEAIMAGDANRARTASLTLLQEKKHRLPMDAA
ncbi:GntR family transcriptional regulator [Cohaesibacter celericrescens]|uniref:GntR family transcriptional regulator n=2 Tax=Cohaesibacter celericrescens TaxID=2067669 RepID=A0A2N5XRG0_9HYPH|nr:GntR family transcriptional regulator [Cohaesibacter celericrescens]